MKQCEESVHKLDFDMKRKLFARFPIFLKKTFFWVLTLSTFVVKIKEMKNGFIDRLINGDGKERKLPLTRKQAFFYYGKEHFFKIVLVSFLSFAFFLPALIWNFLINYGKTMALAALDVESADYLSEYSAVLLRYSLSENLVNIPLIVLGFVGLAGAFAIIKRAVFDERSNFATYFEGIKENWLYFLTAGIIYGVSAFFLMFDITYFAVADFHPVIKGLFTGVGVLQFVIVNSIIAFFCTGVSVYKYKIAAALKNSLLLTFSRLIKSCVFSIICLSPAAVLAFVPSPYQIVGISAYSLFYIGYAVLAETCYCNYVYDEEINPVLGKNCVGRGLCKEEEECPKR